MNRARIIFASGKNLEPYLADLKDSLNANQIIIEVGRTIPSQKVSKEDQIYTCCPNHAVGGIDPHWWHNVRNMERAIRVIEKELIRIDPAGKTIYAVNSKAARTRLTQLDRWVKGQVASIPRGRRHLVTAHAAFGYFCKGYGFKASFVQGLSAQGEVSASQLAGAIKQLRKEAIQWSFLNKLQIPRFSANCKTDWRQSWQSSYRRRINFKLSSNDHGQRRKYCRWTKIKTMTRSPLTASLLPLAPLAALGWPLAKVINQEPYQPSQN